MVSVVATSRVKKTIFLLVSLLSTPFVFAATIDIKPIAEAMQNVWSIIGSLFSLPMSDPVIAAGILRFFIFILVLRVSQAGFRKVFSADDKKTPAVVGFVIAAITVFFTPNTIILSSIVAIAIPLLAIGGITYLAFKKFNGSPISNFIGVVVMFIAGVVATGMLEVYKSPMLGGRAVVDQSFIAPFVPYVLNFIAAMTWLLFIAKLLQWIFSYEATGNLMDRLFSRDEQPQNNRRRSDRDDGTRDDGTRDNDRGRDDGRDDNTRRPDITDPEERIRRLEDLANNPAPTRGGRPVPPADMVVEVE